MIARKPKQVQTLNSSFKHKSPTTSRTKQGKLPNKSAPLKTINIEHILREQATKYLQELYDNIFPKLQIHLDKLRLAKEEQEQLKLKPITLKSTSKYLKSPTTPKTTQKQTKPVSHIKTPTKFTAKKPIAKSPKTKLKMNTEIDVDKSFDDYHSPKFNDLPDSNKMTPRPPQRPTTPEQRVRSLTPTKKSTQPKSPISKGTPKKQSQFLEREVKINEELKSRQERIRQLREELNRLEKESLYFEAQKNNQKKRG